MSAKEILIDVFKRQYEKRIQLVTKKFKEDGEDISNKNVMQSIREEAYNYFLSDDCYNETSHHVWLELTAGRMLLEDGTPNKAIEHIKDDADGNALSQTDKELVEILKKVA